MLVGTLTKCYIQKIERAEGFFQYPNQEIPRVGRCVRYNRHPNQEFTVNLFKFQSISSMQQNRPVLFINSMARKFPGDISEGPSMACIGLLPVIIG